MFLRQPQSPPPYVMKKALVFLGFLAWSLQSITHAASINVSLAQSAHTASGTTSVDLSAEGDLDWAVFGNSPLTPSTRMSGASAYTGMVHVGGASESFYNFYAQNSYSWTNGDSPAAGSNNLTTNADLGSNGAGIRSTFSIASAGTYRLKFYATTSDTNLSATASLSSGGVTETVSGTETAGLQKYEFTVEFATDAADTLTLDIVKDGGSIILAYKAFSLAAVDVTPVPNLNIESSFSFTNASTAETFQIPYNNNGQEPLSVSGVTAGGADAAHFSVASFDSSLAVGASGNIALNFNPGAGDRVYNTTLTIVSNDSDSPSTVVNISVNSGNVVSGCVMDLFIVAGQSNANGLGERANYLSSTQAGPHDVRFYCSWHSDGNNAETQQYFSDWADQTEAGYTRAYWYDNRFGNGGALGGDTDAGALGPSSWFGPEIGFAARALELNLTGGNQLGIIKYGVDGSGLNTSTKNPGTSDWDLTAAGYRQGDAWRGFKLAIADAVAKLESDGITPNFKGMIWWQGEGGTSTAGLNEFIEAVRDHLATNYDLQDSDDFPVVITTGSKMSGGLTLESGVAGADDDVTFVNADNYGQIQTLQIHVGRASEGSSDWTGNGINDMYDIGEAYADALATIVEPTPFISDCSGGGNGGGTAEPAPGGGYYVDVFMATGQSNAFWPNDQVENYYGLGRGAEELLIESGLFSNPTVVKKGHPGSAIGGWWGEWAGGAHNWYFEDFFNSGGTGALQAKLAEILAAGDTPRFRGFFWWQGESDGIGDYASANTTQADYEMRWDGILEALDADLQAAGVDHTQYKFVVNTVSESGTQINNILNHIATSGTNSYRGTIFDAIDSIYHGPNKPGGGSYIIDDYRELHDYDHFGVGRANAQLLIDTFPIVTDGYTITFVNVDGSVTTQTVADGGTPTPPAPINTDTRVFTAWSPSIVSATADVTYTAEYGPAAGEFVDVFIATGQSNAWGPADDGLWFDSGSNNPTYEFGQGVASVLESSDKFSNPVVVLEGAPGQPLGQWWWDGNEQIVFNAPNVLYKLQFFDAANPGVGTLDAKFQEIIAAGNTPRFRGLFWFQGENDGGYNGSSTPNPATPDATYKVRWNGFVDQIAADVGSSDFNFVVNTVGMVDPAINDTLASIASLDSRGALFDTQVAPYRDMEPGTTDVPNGDVHGYDHFAVGVANAQLFLDTFYSDQPAPSSYTITFINVDDSTTVQTVDAGVVPTPPAGVNTDNRTFTGWPTIVAATANTTYTALYTQSGNIVDLFIATGQSNAAWPWDSENQVGTFQFGAGVQAALTASGRFSNPTVVSQGEPGMPIDQWWQSGAPQWAYQKNFFGTYQSQTAALEAKIAEIEAAGDTPVFRGVFWFQGEADGQNGTTEADYTERWNSILGQLTSDVGTGDYYFVMNTVGNSGNLINTILTNITNANPRGALFNTQVVPYRTNFQDIHGYDHFAVGEANVQLYIDTFVDGTPAPSYTITFVNVDDSVTTQTMFEGEVAIPPAGVDTDNRTFTAWPTVAPATADATYTAEYTIDDGSINLGKILCVGDSITEGSATRPAGEGNWSWRYAFWKHLVDNGVNHEFVGTSTYNYDASNETAVSVYPDSNSESFVNRHEAYWGLAAYQVGAMLTGNLATLKDQDETPDTAVVFLGGNDIFQNPSSTAESVRDSIKDIIDKLQGDVGDSGNPNIRILLVSILPRFNLGGGSYTDPIPENTLFESINALLEPLASAETTASSEVTYLDLATTFETTANVFYDGIHPNGSGEQLEADAIFAALVGYRITFVNVDGTETTQIVAEGGDPVPPTGVNDGNKIFTGWGTIYAAYEDRTYTANYSTDLSASISVSLSQTANSGVGGTTVNLTDEGDLDWAVFAGDFLTPNVSMSGGSGFNSMSYIGSAVDDESTVFSGQYNFTWSNGDSPTSGSNTLAANATLPSSDDGIRLTFDLSAAGSYQLKFYSTTYDVNLQATASLASAGVSDGITGSYVSAGTETYEYTIDFTTVGADTLTLDLVKSEGGNFILAYQAFSLASVGDNGGGTTYEIAFVNVDGTETTQTVNENVVATPPAGVNTDTRTFTSWPTIALATADATYTALYSEVNTTYTITFINVDGTTSIQTVGENEVATPPAGVDTDTRTFTSWPTVTPASADATYTASYTVDVGSYDLLWDGGGVDNSWMTPENWDPDALPATGQTLAIINGDTVDIPNDDYELGRSTTINVAGGSQLTNGSAAARFHTNMVFNFFAGSGIGGVWLQVENTTFNFEDGASFTAATVQHRFTSTYGLTLSSTGFTTLTPGILRSWDSDTDWSDVVFNLDVSSYDANNGLVVELIDFTNHDPIYSDNFTPTVNVTAGTSGLTGTLSFDSANSKVIYTFDSVPNTYEITFVNVDDTQVLQTVAEGVSPIPPAGVSTDTRNFTSWPTIDPATEDTIYTALYDEPVTYTITFINVDGTETIQAVNENEAATPPTGVDTATRLFKGWPTVAAATANTSYTALYDEIPVNADIIWDGDAEDGEWTTAANWSTDSLPINTDEVFVGALATVTSATGDFASLEIAEGSSVSFAYEYPGNKTFNVSGVLDRDSPSVLRPGGSVINLSSTGSIGSNLTFLDLGTNTRMSFVDGASFATTTTIELRGATTFDFELSATGFTALELGNLADGGITGWSELTFNIDVSAYDVSNGINIILMDFASQASVFTGTFNPNVNIIAEDSGIGGALSYNASTYDLILTIDPPGNDAPVASDLSYAFDGTATVDITLTATDNEGDSLTYEVVDGPSSGALSGTAPNLTYTFSGASPDHDSFTFKSNDGSVDSNVATVSIVYVPRTAPDLWGWLQDTIENEPLNSATVTTWTEPHSDGSGDTITISRVTYELGELVGTQHTATPVIAGYYAYPTGETNLPGLIQNHGGGQHAQSSYAKFWAEQGYAAICINWGGFNLEERNPNEPASPVDALHPNTNWDGLPGGFYRPDTVGFPMENPVEEAIFWASVDPVTYSDGQTLFDIPHPLNSSWILNGYAARRAITFLQSQSQVDDSKIGVLGWSMGGRTTMMSSTDPRITALAPAVGGTGYLFEDFWGLPGTARTSNGWQDMDLFKSTVADQAYWPHVSAPVLFLNGSNDFNAPFDLATKSLSIHETGLNDVSPTNILVTDPHYNHRVTDPSLAARVLWMRHYLQDGIDFPVISDAELELVTADGIPLFKVYPDTSTSYAIESVDIYYGLDRDSRTRFWRDAGAVDRGTHWEAPLPIFDAGEMMVAHAVITYDLGFTQEIPFGSSTNLLTVASKVHTYYPTGVDDAYSLPTELDTEVHQFHIHDPATLVAAGLRETAEISDAIDDPSGPRGLKDWYLINASNTSAWQYFTRKISDVCYLGGEGAQLTFELTADAANTLVVKIVNDDWNEGDQTRYLTYVPVSVGLNQVSLSLSDFKRVDNTELTSWSDVKILGFGSGQAFNLDEIGWSGSHPQIANLAWNGGERFVDGVVSTAWLDSYQCNQCHVISGLVTAYGGCGTDACRKPLLNSRAESGRCSLRECDF